MAKILIVVGGSVKKLTDFAEASNHVGIPVTLASLNNITFLSLVPNKLLISGIDPLDFEVVYIRMVGKHLEDTTLLINYLKDKKIRLVDRVYHTEQLIPSTISKAHETMKLINAGVEMPKTYYGSLESVIKWGKDNLNYPFILKSTSGRRAREVWIAESDEALADLYSELRIKEKAGMRFFAQEFVNASVRYRILVIGGRAVAGIFRPTKWRKRFNQSENEFKGVLNPIPEKTIEIAIKAAEATQLDIAGVDILVEDETGRELVIEANAAPAWKLIKKDLDIPIEQEIIKYLNTL